MGSCKRLALRLCPLLTLEDIGQAGSLGPPTGR